MSLKIVPFLNVNNEERFQVIAHTGTVFLCANGYGFKSKDSAYRGILAFAIQQKKKKTKHKLNNKSTIK